MTSAGDIDHRSRSAGDIDHRSRSAGDVDHRSPSGDINLRRVADVRGVPMSALVAEARAEAQATEPRAVVVALHGGGTTSAYFDCPGRPRLSLLRIGAALGFTVVALDRPGYGSSAGYPEAMERPGQRVDLAYEAVDGLLQGAPRGAGMFLFAHSLGCELALRMAADARAADLLGISMAGTGRRHDATARTILTAPDHREIREGLRTHLWQPARLYPPEMVGGDAISSGGAPYEAVVVKTWAKQEFPALAAQVRAPVQFIAGDHENVWESTPAARNDIADMFTASSRVVVALQSESGHNLSLGFTAAAYHLKVLSFVEECVVARESARIEPEAC
jgi:pimeloyl-ACP methyl ester carboxylesterase